MYSCLFACVKLFVWMCTAVCLPVYSCLFACVQLFIFLIPQIFCHVIKLTNSKQMNSCVGAKECSELCLMLCAFMQWLFDVILCCCMPCLLLLCVGSCNSCLISSFCVTLWHRQNNEKYCAKKHWVTGAKEIKANNWCLVLTLHRIYDEHTDTMMRWDVHRNIELLAR